MKREETQDTDCAKPIIEYPCRWTYTVIGSDSNELERVIEEIVGGRDYTVAPSHTSKKGTYCSLNLEVLVDDEGCRTGIYETLRKHPAVKIVL
ncbi:MAG TPA: DUF493 domain-containing protein [Syntrophales bacterium]|nr:DUF493 domain-containing protein [Syntrophales bacterium]HPQ44116.1 DUF493 domain-containing protein [Syntrophales bacterium]